ncbi:MAG: type I-E CRISPR-associated protein Cas6/Cse3/CasE [Hyphomicrobiales bacterium]|nr:type I-E CRISPR-associated protein Cas6/Cse3/CasE [Hyphomicrobiales bacterium]
MSNSPLYMSRARLKTARGEALSAIAPLLLRGSKGDTVGHAHRILWMLFQGRGEDEKRDFLWREEMPGHYLILSQRPPEDSNHLFDIDTKDFAPELSAGDRLAFNLRANPVVSRKAEGARLGKQDGKGRVRSVRCDIIMDALHPLGGFKGPRDENGQTERAAKRDAILAEVAQSWIGSQGERHGFKLVLNPDNDKPYLGASNYETIQIPRMKDGKLVQRTQFATFGLLDFAGMIEVTDPMLFLTQLVKGFGKAKAFGCGLMLIKRAA